MSDADSGKPGPRPPGHFLILAGAIAVLAGVMYYTWTYPFPDGKQPEFWGFVAFFAREIIAMIIAAMTVLLVVVVWCVTLVTRWTSRPIR